MAEVWRAVHAGQQLPVAVKVITRAAARDALFRDVLKNEVRSVARLDHPGIIMILDHGEITEESEAASSGALTAGSPYLAMELASWGSLDRLQHALEWPDLCRILLGLLDALAHAHARGVLHRDLKPGNILVSSAEDLRPGIKLTDFGIAHALEPPANKKKDHPLTGGTPLFMAPEQFVGDWREFGPWTDLYAVGCLAFLFAMGRPPFTAETASALGVQHIRDAPPSLVPFHPMPAGFESWVLRLLAKDPAERYQRAADAAWALARLERDEAIDQSGRSRPNSSTSVLEGHVAPTTLPWMVDEKLLENVTPPGQLLDEPRKVGLMKRELPPLPFSWRTPPRAPPPPKLIGASLALYGVRRVPLVGRDEERDLLWSRLSRVRDADRAEIVLLQGPAGIGKSRIAEWLCERADEVGGASVMKAFFGPMRSPSEAIAGMLERYLRTSGLDHDPLRDRVALMLQRQGVTDGYESSALAELIARRSDRNEARTSHSVHFTTAVERHNVVQRLLSRAALERPVVVWFDDVQWGADALIYARHLLERREEEPCRVLIVMTVRDDLLASRPMEAELIQELASRAGATRCTIGPLPAPHQQTLIHELLGLRQDLASEVGARSDGNPLFAVQLVDDWVRRGVLDLDDSGFRLKDGEEAELPADLRTMWLDRIEELLEGEPAESIVALELAAILGSEVVIEEWQSACSRYGISVPPSLLTSMMDHRLLYGAGARFTFAHNMLRESLEEHARERRRYATHHRLCAETLASRHESAPGAAERIGRHYLEAGSYAEALRPLYGAAIERWNGSDYDQAQRLLVDYERTLASIAADNADPQWSDCWILRARIANLQGRYKEAITWSERARDHAQYFSLKGPMANALRERATVAHVLGDTDYAGRLLREAEALMEEEEDAQGLALCHLATADVLFATGDLAGARKRYERTARALETDGDWVGVTQALHGLGSVAFAAGDRPAARSAFERELQMAERTGNRHAFARAKAALAELERDRGNLAPAERDLRHAIEILEAIGSSDAAMVRIDLALLLLEAGDYVHARRELHPLRARAESTEEPREICRLRMALAADAAAYAQWSEVQNQTAEVKMTLEATGLVDRKLASTAQLVAELAQRHGRTDEAKQALEVARSQRPLG